MEFPAPHLREKMNKIQTYLRISLNSLYQVGKSTLKCINDLLGCYTCHAPLKSQIPVVKRLGKSFPIVDFGGKLKKIKI